MWCHRQGRSHIVGVAFDSPTDDFDVRMVEQICHIHAYRDHVWQHEQRALTTEQAAQEWIARHASEFPG